MPRKIKPEMTLDDVEDEILFTRAALTADPNAQGFLDLTKDWLAGVDGHCVVFGDALFLAVGKDRQSAAGNSSSVKPSAVLSPSRLIRRRDVEFNVSLRTWSIT